jgi:hypothetical protein
MIPTSDVIRAWGNLGLASALALAVLALAGALIYATLSFVKRQAAAQAAQTAILRDSQNVQADLWRKAIEQFTAGQKAIADGLTTQTAAISHLAQSVGADQLNDIRAGAAAMAHETQRQTERLAGLVDRLAGRVEALEKNE